MCGVCVGHENVGMSVGGCRKSMSVMASERLRSHNLLEIKFAERRLQGSMILNCRTNKDVFYNK